MELIDEQGNLFGAVNVIDALVIVFALGVVVAGVAILGQSDDAPEATQSVHVTIELEQQPTYVAERLSEGDTMVHGDQRLTITDVYLAPGTKGRVSLTVAAEVEGREGTGNPSIEFAGDPVQPGRMLNIRTNEYDVNGTITSISDDRDRLDVTRTSVTLRTTVDGKVAHRIRQGDTYEIAGQEVATVDSVSVFRTGNVSQQRVLVELDVRTLRSESALRLGGRPLKIGTTVPFSTDEYDVTGTVVDREGLQDGGATDTITTVVKLEDVEPAFVDAVEVGDEERTRGNTYARVTDKRVEPAVVILTSDDGNIFDREHPRNKDVYLTVELTVRETRDGIRFHGKRLQEGNDVILDFGTITVNGTVIEMKDG